MFIKQKSFILGAMVASSLLVFACNKSQAGQYRPLEPAQQPKKCMSGKPNCPMKMESVENHRNGSYNNGKKTNTPHASFNSTESFKGKVKSIDRIRYPNRTQLHLSLETPDMGTVKVVLGPATFVNQSATKILVGDDVQVIGHKTTVNGEEIIIASEVKKKNGNTLKLRDSQGRPLWQP